MNKYCVIIPVYNHPQHLATLLNYFKSLNIFVILVDDGSNASTQAVIETLAINQKPYLTAIRHAVNGGKGAAIKTGFREALKLGFTHAIQIDSDGQHHWQDTPKFIEFSDQYPDRVILGQPIFNQNQNKHRYYARYLTHVWIWINTLSLSIKDSMCGFRIYPLSEVTQLLSTQILGDRMDFDPEIVVRLKWQGCQFINLPTEVNYPVGNTSNFMLFQDNFLISKMHTKMFFLMLKNIPNFLYLSLAELSHANKKME